MQWFPDCDNILILEKHAGLRRTEIYLQAGMPVRSQTHELSRESRGGPHHSSLREAVRENITLPWDRDAEEVIEEVDDLTNKSSWTKVNKRYGFFIKTTKKRFIKIIDLGDTDISKEDFGLVLVHYFFATAMRFSKIAIFNTPENADMFDRGREFCLKVLATHIETWAVILRVRLVTTAFAAIWNDTKREQRDSLRMRALVAEYDLFNKLKYLNELCPKHLGAPFNALAAASRFKDRDNYRFWCHRLVVAAPQFKRPNKVADAFLDDDFADFRLWMEENPHGYKPEGDGR